MIVIAAALIGAAIGAQNARRRQGTRFDILQYAAAYGLAFAILGVFATVILARMG